MSDQSTINRRKFISAGWTDPDIALVEPRGEIASILVQAKPDRLTEVEAAISALGSCEIHGRVDGAIGDTLNRIAMTEGVLSAALVFHATDTG